MSAESSRMAFQIHDFHFQAAYYRQPNVGQLYQKAYRGDNKPYNSSVGREYKGRACQLYSPFQQARWLMRKGKMTR